MRIVRAEQKQDDRHAQQELFGRRILIAIVNLLPHVEIVVGAGIELEGNPLHVVEHEVGAKHICDVGERPRGLLAYARHSIEEDLEEEDQERVYKPGTCVRSPISRTF